MGWGKVGLCETQSLCLHYYSLIIVLFSIQKPVNLCFTTLYIVYKQIYERQRKKENTKTKMLNILNMQRAFANCF